MRCRSETFKAVTIFNVNFYVDLYGGDHDSDHYAGEYGL
jgi:hypothetical protein